MQQRKYQLRALMSDRILAMREKERSAESRSVSRRIIEALPVDCTALCAYAPLKTEVDIVPVLRHALEKGIALYLPRSEGDGNVFRRVDRLGKLTVGSYGTLEPPEDAPALPEDAFFIALIPGRAFDRQGNRLGRGNGAFDHWIADRRTENPQNQFWGISFECQLLQEVPVEAHDQKVDALVMARGMLEML